MEANLQILQRTLEDGRRRGTRCAVVMIPAAQGWDGQEGREAVPFHRVADTLGIPVLTITFDTRDPSEYLYDGTHLSDRGLRRWGAR